MAFKVLNVDHIGIGVSDLAATKEFYKNTLGIEHLPEDEVVEEQKVKVASSHVATLNWNSWIH
mgnify:FL=1